ncbi:MAG TPA: hypothetical protein VMV45_07920 [Casimicrobiaceae bacterium]|nr:hypothetical protein [Casimicrobiaceae bacterium]
MALVRVLFFFALASIVVALVLYAVKRDRRYLRFVLRVAQYTLLLLLGVFVWFAVGRIVR